MKPRFFSAVAYFIMAFWLASAGLLFSQEASQPPLEPGLPGPVLTPPTPPSDSARAGTLTLEERADIFMARKSYADALEYYQRAMREEGRSPAVIWNKIGIAHQQMQNFGAARKAYKESMRLSKDFAEPWNNMGTTYYLEQRPKKSLKWYRQAIKLNPNSATFHVNLGTSYYAMKKLDQALQEYQTALGLDPSVFSTRSSAGTTMQARAADARYFYLMAKVFASKGRPEEAVRYLRRAFEDGFKDTKLLDQDPDFLRIAEFPAYIELRANPPKAL
jgi:tetratricopeptide (TPR) repeat protein